jgi:hypothetical protein
MVEEDAASRPRGVPIAFALFSLVPIGVGLAYLVYYRSDTQRDNTSPIP